MKKIAGILLIIFTFFICNSVVYGETETVNFDKSFAYGGDYTDTNVSGYGNYWFDLFKIQNTNTKAHCLEAGIDYNNSSSSYTKTVLAGTTAESLGFLKIINSGENDEIINLATRLFYSYINGFKVAGTSITYGKSGFSNIQSGKKISDYCFGNHFFRCSFAKAAYLYTHDNELCSGTYCFTNGKNEYLNKAKSLYLSAVKDYDSTKRTPIYFKYDKSKSELDTDYLWIKSNYKNKICLTENENQCYTKLDSNYYRISRKNAKDYIENEGNTQTLHLYIPGSAILYTIDGYQDMLVLGKPSNAKIKITGDDLTHNTKCEIVSSCSNLDNTCGNDAGTIKFFVKNLSGPDSISLGDCLKSDTSIDKKNIDPNDLLYKSSQKYNGDDIFCLESIGMYLGSSRITVNSKGETFGVYPYISSTLKCASGTTGTEITDSTLMKEILKEYYGDFSGSNINIKDNSTTPKTFSKTPEFEVLSMDKLEELYVDSEYSTDLTTLPNQLLRYSAGLDNVFYKKGTTEKDMLSFDFNSNGKIDSNDASIVSKILLTETDFTNKYDTVYLYFLPEILYSSPLLGKTSTDIMEYNLGYNFALNYGLNLTNNTTIGSYSLNVELYTNKFASIINNSTCSLNCNSDIYFDIPDNLGLYCIMPNGEKANYIDYYNEDETKYSMCNINNSLEFSEPACKEAIGCNPFDVGGIDYWYRPITLNDVFPNTMNDTSKKPSLKNKYRVTGANWAVKKGRETQQEIEKDGEKIYKNNTSSTTKNKVYYKITLTPQNMKEIRDYNDNQEKYDEGYADFTLDCDDKGFACKSSFLTDLLDENYGDYNDNEFNLSNARNWTKYTDGTAWK